MSDATKSETKSFIAEKTQVIWNKGDYRKEKHQALHFRNDTIILKITKKVNVYYKNKPRSLQNSPEEYRVELKVLDPDRVESTSDGTIILRVKENKELVEYEYMEHRYYSKFLRSPDYYESKQISSQSSICIDTFDSSLNAPKCVKAFKHLIELCGGRGELF